MIIFFFFFNENPWAAIIQKERRIKGLTQTELGELIGKSMRTIQNYESGKVNPPYKVLEKMAEIFDETPQALLDKYGGYDETIPAHFDGDVNKYEDYKKAVDQDHENEEGLNAITRIYEKLNQEGKYEAYKRISELAELKKYIPVPK